MGARQSGQNKKTRLGHGITLSLEYKNSSIVPGVLRSRGYSVKQIYEHDTVQFYYNYTLNVHNDTSIIREL